MGNLISYFKKQTEGSVDDLPAAQSRPEQSHECREDHIDDAQNSAIRITNVTPIDVSQIDTSQIPMSYECREDQKDDTWNRIIQNTYVAPTDASHIVTSQIPLSYECREDHIDDPRISVFQNTDIARTDAFQIDTGQIPASLANMPPEILVQIFVRVPAEKRLVVATVRQSWRNIFLQTPVCWRGISLGRNANRFQTPPPANHLSNFYPITHVEEIRFSPAIPAVLNHRRLTHVSMDVGEL